MELIVNYNGRTLAPATPLDLEKMQAELRPGQQFAVKCLFDLNVKLHRKFMALLGKALQYRVVDPEFEYEFHDKEALRHWLLCRIGWCTIVNLGGQEQMVPKSMRLDELEESQLREIFRAGIYMLAQWCPDCDDVTAEADGIIERGYEFQRLDKPT